MEKSLNVKQEFYRFQLFVTKSLREGRETRKIVGASYLREGQKVYTLRFWMFPDVKFYLMPDQEDATKMIILTREEKRNPNVGKGKYFWNLIGTGAVDVAREVVKLDFDLIDKPIYMSIFPSQAQTSESEHFADVLDAS